MKGVRLIFVEIKSKTPFGKHFLHALEIGEYAHNLCLVGNNLDIILALNA